LKRLLVPVLALFVAQAAAQSTGRKSDWEEEQEKRNWRDSAFKLPDFPKMEGLIEFPVSAVSNFRFYVDPASVAREADGVVRYTLVARSPSGFANISYEGIRCTTNSYKIYAYGNDGRWTVRESEWRTIEPRAIQRWHLELRSRYFCPRYIQILTAEEGVDALRRGGHPSIGDKVQGD
jgi:hypothetical protein